MDKSIGLSEERIKKDKKSRNNLVITVDENERIIKFNKKSQDLSGYSKEDALNKKIFGFIIPSRYENQWNNFLKTSRKNKIVDDMKLPILTKNGHEIMLSWISFPVKNEKGKIGDINIIGSIVKSWIDDNESSIVSETNINQKHSESEISVNNEIDDLNLKQLYEINYELIEKNHNLEKELKKLKKSSYHKKDKEIDSDSTSEISTNRGVYSISRLFGGKKRKQEYDRVMIDLDERVKQLDEKESELIREKQSINDCVIEFKNWREKLESLENDIENRRNQLEKKEKAFVGEITGTIDDIEDQKTIIDLKQSNEKFDEISESAVVIQRGIIKKVNKSFSDLIGYNSKEMIDKSLFDFICSEGFFEIEKYYFNRLKGEDVTNYNTIFLTKDNNKVPVEVNPKQTIINGDIAEIAIVKKINNEKKEK
jgi:PAS domain S-box-containing protein